MPTSPFQVKESAIAFILDRRTITCNLVSQTMHISMSFARKILEELVELGCLRPPKAYFQRGVFTN